MADDTENPPAENPPAGNPPAGDPTDTPAESGTATEQPVTVAHYFSGLAGAALLRRWYESGTANDARLADLRTALDHLDEFPYNIELNPAERSVSSGYRDWAGEYDGPNPMIEAEEAVLDPWLRQAVIDVAPATGLSVQALDAGCGTGRHAARLESLDCAVTAIDATVEMLDVARTKLSPSARVIEGDLAALPLDDDCIDLAVSSLAICHLPSPAPAMAELARVVRPGGVIVISDPHPTSGLFGGQAFYGGIDGGMQFVRNHYASMSEWIAAFVTHGVLIDECVEIPFGAAAVASNPLSALNPDVVAAALEGTPFIVAWRLRVT